MQTAKASRKQSSLSGKESAQGCIPKRLPGRPDEALGGGKQGPSAPAWARQHHRQRDPPFVPRKRLPDWASPELSPSVESCGCVFGLPRCVLARESTAPGQGNQSLSRELRARALCPGLEARFPARRREERGCGPVTGKDRASCQSGGAPALRPGAIAQSPGREAALAWASLAQRFPASSVLAREGAGCGSVGDVPGAWLASAPLWPSLWT